MRSIPRGKFRSLITIQEPVAERDGYNDRDPSWVDVAQAWAWVRQLRGGQLLEAGQIEARYTHRVVLLWTRSCELTSRHRLILQGRILEISSVTNVEERNRYWDVMAIEVEGATV